MLRTTGDGMDEQLARAIGERVMLRERLVNVSALSASSDSYETGRMRPWIS